MNVNIRILLSAVVSISLLLSGCLPSNCRPEVLVEIQGRVVDFQLQPVANAQISIESDSGRLSACDAYNEIPSIQTVTDVQGYFDTDHTAQTILSFSITITASGCHTYQADDLSFSILRQHPLDDEVMTFVMTCEG